MDLKHYVKLPKWLEDSQLIRQMRFDFPGEELHLDSKRIFEIPEEIATENLIPILENVRYFGVNDSSLFSRLFAFIFLSNKEIVGDLKRRFPEFEAFWLDLMFMLESKHSLSNQMCQNAAVCGFVYSLEFAHRMGYSWDENVCKCAALNGHFDCLKYAHENGCPWR
jgi:hypothetical protein